MLEFGDLVPPTSRHDDQQASADREQPNRVVRETFVFAMGMLYGLGGARDMPERIARMHDHKGCLGVACWRPLTANMTIAIRRAWEEVGMEAGENVDFIPVGSEAWDYYWPSRFPSNWTPYSYGIAKSPDDAERIRLAEWLDDHMPGKGRFWSLLDRHFVCFDDAETLARFLTRWRLTERPVRRTGGAFS
jgi:hypothetical protein